MDLLIDSDCGFDDMLALCVMLGHKSVRLRGITSVHGMSSPGLGATTMCRLLKRLGEADCCVAGAPEPRPGGALLEEVDWGREYIASYPIMVDLLDLPTIEPIPDGTATAAGQAILANAAKHPGATLLCLGPLTNVAAALELQTEPGQLASLLSRVVVMGGAVRVSGNMGPNDEAELNFFSDPDAAAIVMSSGLPIELADLDCTGEKAFGDKSKLDVLKHLGGLEATSPTGQLLQKLLQNDLDLLLKDEETICCLYDPVAACYAMNPAAFESERINIEADPKSGATHECKPLDNSTSTTACVTVPTGFKEPGQYQQTLASLITAAPTL